MPSIWCKRLCMCHFNHSSFALSFLMRTNCRAALEYGCPYVARHWLILPSVALLHLRHPNEGFLTYPCVCSAGARTRQHDWPRIWRLLIQLESRAFLFMPLQQDRVILAVERFQRIQPKPSIVGDLLRSEDNVRSGEHFDAGLAHHWCGTVEQWVCIQTWGYV